MGGLNFNNNNNNNIVCGEDYYNGRASIRLAMASRLDDPEVRGSKPFIYSVF
jgi:hypothetical protein